MKTLSSALFADLLGRPFEQGARGPFTYDCLGLAAELQRRLGRNLPPFVSCEAELHRQVATGGVLEECRRIKHPVAGCVVLMRSTSIAGRHIGTMIDPARMIHASEVSGSVVIESLSHTFWARRVLGFYAMEDAQ